MPDVPRHRTPYKVGFTKAPPSICNFTQGFDDGVNSVWTSSGMYETINSLYNEKGKDRKLFIAGHSLGGALATIAGARLALGDQTVNTMKISGIYTFGSPR